MRRHLTYANVVSTLALCLVVGGGGAYAATKLANNSVKAKHIASGAVASSEIKNRSVRLQDLAADVTGKNGAPGLKGDQGPVGPVGPQGVPGTPGASGQNLDFDGVRMGALTRYAPSADTEITLGRAGSVGVYAKCYMSSADVVRYSVYLRRDTGVSSFMLVFGAGVTNSLGAGATAGLTPYDANLTSQPWSASVTEVGGDTYDIRGVAYRQNPQYSALPPAGYACGLTEAYVEKVSR
jgi:hypothetical protein